MWSDVQVAPKQQHCGTLCGGPQVGASCPGIMVQMKTDATIRVGRVPSFHGPNPEKTRACQSTMLQSKWKRVYPVKGQPDFNQVSESLVSADVPGRCRAF